MLWFRHVPLQDQVHCQWTRRSLVSIHAAMDFTEDARACNYWLNIV